MQATEGCTLPVIERLHFTMRQHLFNQRSNRDKTPLHNVSNGGNDCRFGFSRMPAASPPQTLTVLQPLAAHTDRACSLLIVFMDALKILFATGAE